MVYSKTTVKHIYVKILNFFFHILNQNGLHGSLNVWYKGSFLLNEIKN